MVKKSLKIHFSWYGELIFSRISWQMRNFNFPVLFGVSASNSIESKSWWWLDFLSALTATLISQMSKMLKVKPDLISLRAHHQKVTILQLRKMTHLRETNSNSIFAVNYKVWKPLLLPIQDVAKILKSFCQHLVYLLLQCANSSVNTTEHSVRKSLNCLTFQILDYELYGDFGALDLMNECISFVL